tara:strand:- start:541 stop:912 length:372 start_codon:yes stop_codon:yes gene_type:complete
MYEKQILDEFEVYKNQIKMTKINIVEDVLPSWEEIKMNDSKVFAYKKFEQIFYNIILVNNEGIKFTVKMDGKENKIDIPITKQIKYTIFEPIVQEEYRYLIMTFQKNDSILIKYSIISPNFLN